MSKQKSGWEKAQQSQKKNKKEDLLLTKTHKLTSFFQVVQKKAEHSSNDVHSNSPPISFQSDTAKTKFSAVMMMMMMMI